LGGLNFESGFNQAVKLIAKTFPYASRRFPQESRNAYRNGNASFTADCLSRTCMSVGCNTGTTQSNCVKLCVPEYHLTGKSQTHSLHPILCKTAYVTWDRLTKFQNHVLQTACEKGMG